ncbi:MAG TPA: malto-oligosyltrehalose synthase, partial [Candidatus Acidoferrales bacterium]|nr:malto-oligosyltrehalose synthase [Candidatus Acidoferrales bacterium]
MPKANGEPRPARTPSATYRLQLNSQFTFRMITSLVGYLHELGISDCYLSPFLKARSGSTHGYDITDYGTLNPEIGDEQDLRQLAAELKSKGMGTLIDVVPNHMCVAPSNDWWADVLERGRDSPYADFFDIEWNPDQTNNAEPVNYPILNETMSEALQTQKLRVLFEDGKFLLKYDNMPLPLCLGSWVEVLDSTLHRLNERHGENHPAALELNAILQILRRYKAHSGDDDYYRNRSIVEKRLLTLSDSDEEARDGILQSVETANSNENLLKKLLNRQAYRLIPWRSGTSEINYRRFFDINDLAALRVENPRVFAAINASVFHFVAQSWVSGLRIDHPDGLWDPELYLLGMQRSCESAKREKGSLIQSAIEPVEPKDGRPFYIVVEKILTGSEALRRTWPVYGTTGYEFLNLLNGVFVEPSGAAKIQEIYADFVGRRMKFDETVYECKKLVLMQNFLGDFHRVFRALLRIRDLPKNVVAKELEQALAEVVVCFRVYRSYVRSTSPLADEDQRLLSSALELAKERYLAISEPTCEYLRSIFSDCIPDGLRLRQRIFLCRLQQLTAPVMAKGLEDTALYRYTPLSSLNEVGGDPAALGTQLSEFHRSNEERLKHWPYALSTTSTHDTKRSEDVRARLDALSEMPDAWLGALGRWRRANEGRKRIVDGELTPDGQVEYLLYQTLVGAWPLITSPELRSEFVGRMKRYMLKALREAKIHSNWLTPNEKYEQA